jgi:hypothetical protein
LVVLILGCHRWLDDKNQGTAITCQMKIDGPLVLVTCQDEKQQVELLKRFRQKARVWFLAQKADLSLVDVQAV